MPLHRRDSAFSRRLTGRARAECRRRMGALGARGSHEGRPAVAPALWASNGMDDADRKRPRVVGAGVESWIRGPAD